MIDQQGLRPDWASPPGDTVSDILEERGLTVADFVTRLGRTREEVDSLLDGSSPITLSIAQELSEVLGAPASFWIHRESQFRKDQLESQHRVTANQNWIKELPVADMVRYGWIPTVKTSADKLSACLDFFGVSGFEEWREKRAADEALASFRTSMTFDSAEGAMSAWLRQGELEASKVECAPWNRGAFAEALVGIRNLVRKRDPERFIPELRRRCAECGVALVIVRAPNGCRASGAARFLSAEKALIQLSFRYLSDDHFWFTLFHEAGHVLLHGSRRFYVEGVETRFPEDEDEANKFAFDALIPPAEQSAFFALRPETREIIKFAQRIGVSPGVVVGQMQHFKRIRPSQFNSLRRRFEWRTPS